MMVLGRFISIYTVFGTPKSRLSHDIVQLLLNSIHYIQIYLNGNYIGNVPSVNWSHSLASWGPFDYHGFTLIMHG